MLELRIADLPCQLLVRKPAVRIAITLPHLLADLIEATLIASISFASLSKSLRRSAFTSPLSARSSSQ
jgi:hypothetical protein